MENKTYYLTYVVGERGVGKTTLLAHFATEYMIPPRSIDDLKLCRKEIGRLQAGGKLAGGSGLGEAVVCAAV